ncbi:MAG TPA: 5'/3'-nucleotidase SurE [Mycobacteriales bacterium]|nr:5'/3'-nucleotidase SurE [Mycobacteriales bacterium]
MRASRAAAVLAAAAVLPLMVGAGEAASATSTHRLAADSTPTLKVLVTNDDGYRAPGIATVTTALAKLPNVRVFVVAPAKNQSGTGGRTKKGKLKITKGKTLGGHPAYAVHGYPADTIRAALDDLHLHPDVVVSGINAGQNLGPAIDISGTVGAARAAVARGIPAIAVSAGLGNTIHFKAALPFVRRWVKHKRADLLAGSAKVHVLSMNVPSCPKGSVRRMVRIASDLNSKDFNKALRTPNCLSKKGPGKNDVTAFSRGFATEDVIPSTPATTS